MAGKKEKSGKGEVKGRGKGKNTQLPVTRARKVNVTKVKAGRGKPGTPKGEPDRLTTEQYNKMWMEYCKSQSIKKCALAAGVKYETARRYVTGEGRPDDGLVPIKARWIQATAEAQAKEEQSLAAWQREQTKHLKKIINLHVQEYVMIQEHAKARMERYRQAQEEAKQKGDVAMPLPELEVGIDRLTQSLERAVRLCEHLLGGSDITVEHRAESRFADWTEEEKMLYATKGILPEHER